MKNTDSPIQIIYQREKGRGNRIAGSARGQFHKVHAEVTYDLEIDTHHDQGVQDWVELPLWMSTQRSMPGFSKISSQNAQRSGLQIRPLKETISSVLEWDTARNKPKLQAGLDAQKEAKLLAQWKESQKEVMSTPEEKKAAK